MNTNQVKIISTVVFFILIFLFGFWLSRSSKPYPMILFTFHKLIALGAVIFLAVTVYKIQLVTPLSPIQMTAVLFTAFFMIATVITGGLLSMDQELPAIVHKLHQVLPYLTVFSTAVTLYLVLTISKEMLKT